MTLHDILAEELQLLLSGPGVSQKEIAAQIGYDPSTVSQWKTGTRRPSFSAIEATVHALDHRIVAQVVPKGTSEEDVDRMRNSLGRSNPGAATALKKVAELAPYLSEDEARLMLDFANSLQGMVDRRVAATPPERRLKLRKAKE